MPFDFLSLPGFLFLFIVIGSGYFFLEVIMNDAYFGRRMLDRYSNNLFDRLLHYVFWGVSINIAFFLALLRDERALDFLEESGKLGQDIARIFPGGESYADQSYFFLFAFDYWILLFFVLFSILFAMKLPLLTKWLIDKFGQS